MKVTGNQYWIKSSFSVSCFELRLPKLDVLSVAVAGAKQPFSSAPSSFLRRCMPQRPHCQRDNAAWPADQVARWRVWLDQCVVSRDMHSRRRGAFRGGPCRVARPHLRYRLAGRKGVGISVSRILPSDTNRARGAPECVRQRDPARQERVGLLAEIVRADVPAHLVPLEADESFTKRTLPTGVAMRAPAGVVLPLLPYQEEGFGWLVGQEATEFKCVGPRGPCSPASDEGLVRPRPP